MPGTDEVIPPLVSIAMTMKDAGATLAETLDSVFAQDWPNWELIIVDDGSSDDSLAIAESYRNRAPDRIQIFRHPGGANLGKSVSRNLALEQARGPYLAMLDADDVWQPGKTRQQLAILEAMPDVALTYCPVLYWYSWSPDWQPAPKGVEDIAAVIRLPLEVPLPPSGVVWHIIREERLGLEYSGPYPSATLVRTEAARAVGGFDPDFTQLYDDTVFFIKLLLRYSCWISRAPLTQYRLRPHAGLSNSYLEEIAKGNWAFQGPSAIKRRFLDRIADYAAAAADRRALRQIRLAQWSDRWPWLGHGLAAMEHRMARAVRRVKRSSNR